MREYALSSPLFSKHPRRHFFLIISSFIALTAQQREKMATAPKAAPAAVPDATPAEGDAGAPKKSKSKLIVIIGILVVALGAGGGAGWFFMHKHKPASTKDAGGKIDAEADGKAKTDASADASAEGDADADENASAEAKADEEGGGEAKPPVFVVVDPFTVNLQPESGVDQFLQIAFTLQVSNPKQEELVKLYMPQVRSRMLMLLSGKKASELTSTDGKKKLSEEIITQVKESFLPKGAKQGVINVFFTSFVIQ
jgi:flagellar FliL protein